MKNKPEHINRLEEGLDSFDPVERISSLSALAELAEQGMVDLPRQKEILNLHCHTFYSYNGYGFSPSHIAWLGRKLGAKWMGIVDFDVLDGVDEFLDACQKVGVFGTAGVESRVFIPEYGHRAINSPSEPGIAYHMGIGFPSSSAPPEAETPLREIRQRAEDRNRAMLAKLNKFLAPLSIDYEIDVLPKTPAGNATERHMLAVIVERSFTEIEQPIIFWSKKLDLSKDETQDLVARKEDFRNLVRKKLMKRGGVGFAQPTAENFPSIEEFHHIVTACSALPCSAWMDGTPEGERDIECLLGLMVEKGVVALNIVPDRNWNISDPEIKRMKLDNLYHVVSVAKDMHLPLHIGTEMNSYGQKLVDDFDAPELAPIKEDFIAGAVFVTGHTRMQRLWGLGWQSMWAKKHFPQYGDRVNYYQSVGRIIPPGTLDSALLGNISDALSPDQVLVILKE